MTHDGAGIPSPRRGQHDSSRDSHAETGLRLIDGEFVMQVATRLHNFDPGRSKIK